MTTTETQDRILIALTKTDSPRTVRNLHIETGIPKATIRRTLSELHAKGYHLESCNAFYDGSNFFTIYQLLLPRVPHSGEASSHDLASLAVV